MGCCFFVFLIAVVGFCAGGGALCAVIALSALLAMGMHAGYKKEKEESELD